MTLLNSIPEDFFSLCISKILFHIWKHMISIVLVWGHVYTQNLFNTYGFYKVRKQIRGRDEFAVLSCDTLEGKEIQGYVLWINRKYSCYFFPWALILFHVFLYVSVAVKWSNFYNRSPSFSSLIFPLTLLHRYEMVTIGSSVNLFIFPRWLKYMYLLHLNQVLKNDINTQGGY